VCNLWILYFLRLRGYATRFAAIDAAADASIRSLRGWAAPQLPQRNND
jgi:hypothetical protein